MRGDDAGIDAKPTQAAEQPGMFDLDTPVHHHGQTGILGETCYPDLASIPHPIDMVDVFRKPADTPAIAEQAVAIGAKTLWLQLGVVNTDAQAIAEQAGLTVVMDRCVKIEHARLFGGLGWFGVNTGVISAHRQTPPSFDHHG